MGRNSGSISNVDLLARIPSKEHDSSSNGGSHSQAPEDTDMDSRGIMDYQDS